MFFLVGYGWCRGWVMGNKWGEMYVLINSVFIKELEYGLLILNRIKFLEFFSVDLIYLWALLGEME